MLVFKNLNVNLMLRKRKTKVNYIFLICNKKYRLFTLKNIDMKNLIIAVVLLLSVTVFSQEQKVDYKKTDNNLVQATYYFADNNTIVEREGFFNEDGKLHGVWVSYDLDGNKTIVANYNNGVKVGVWMYFKGDKVNVVTYNNNKITNVEEKALAVN